MDDKQDLINMVKESTLPREIKDDLISRIVAQGATKEIAKEVADLLDLRADVLDLEGDVAEQKAKVYEDLAEDLGTADKQEDEETGKILDEADKELDELEKQSGSSADVSKEPQPEAPPTQAPTQ